MRRRSLACLALFASLHRFNRADAFLFRRVRLLLPFGSAQGGGVCRQRAHAMGATGIAGVLAAVLAFLDGAADFLLHRDRGFLDV